MSWEDNYDRDTPIIKAVARACYCPVCPDKKLGTQEASNEISLHCGDCKAWFTYFPGVSKPLARLDRDMAHPCTCPGCLQRRKS